MKPKQIIECVPNFSEGRNPDIIKQITDAIAAVSGVSLLDVDPGKATNRTVVTFVGDPDSVIEGAFQGIKKAASLIDMRHHTGEHPRMGATDVCPLIPISGISMEETVVYAKKLAQRVGEELDIPTYLYEAAASTPSRKNLATIRAGEYEGLEKKLLDPQWKPDFGPASFNATAGATVVGARDFLVAYNVNLNTTSVKRANSVAFDVRENGRIKREGDPVTGKIVTDENGEPIRIPGMLKSVKAIGWYIEEYKIAQVSMNLTNISDTTLHEAFEACRKSADQRGMRVTGSELVGLVPKKVMLDAGKFYLHAQGRSVGVSEEEIIHIAIKSLGLDELGPFDPKKKIIEYLMDDASKNPLVRKTLVEFADETASESMAPGGGSISAYVGALGVALGTMVANLSAQKHSKGDKLAYFSDLASKGQQLKDQLLADVDADTHAFNAIIDAIRMPKESEHEIEHRKTALHAATIGAIEVPLTVMKRALAAYEIVFAMAENGNKSSVSDAGVGALCLHTAVAGAYLNVKINCKDFEDVAYTTKTLEQAAAIFQKSSEQAANIEKIVAEKIGM